MSTARTFRRIMFVVFLICLVLQFVLAEILSLQANSTYWESLYSTTMTALTIGPTLNITTSGERIVIVITAISGITMMESSLTVLISTIQISMKESERKVSYKVAKGEQEEDLKSESEAGETPNG